MNSVAKIALVAMIAACAETEAPPKVPGAPSVDPEGTPVAPAKTVAEPKRSAPMSCSAMMMNADAGAPR